MQSKMKKIVVESLEQLPVAAEQVISFLNENGRRFMTLKGQMGAGKTTLVNELIKRLGVEEEGSSPTFSIVNEYFSVTYGTIYHFDFYRIEDESEAYDIGVEEIFEEDAFIFIEWPERIENLIPDNIVELSIIEENGIRHIELQLT